MPDAISSNAPATVASLTDGDTGAPSSSLHSTESAVVAAATDNECTAIVPAASTDIVQWYEYIDPASGCPYYHDAVSGLTVWEKPAVSDETAKVLHDTTNSATEGQEQQLHEQQQLSVVPIPPAFYYNARGNRVFCVPRQDATA
jgi:hypothetical protein